MPSADELRVMAGALPGAAGAAEALVPGEAAAVTPAAAYPPLGQAYWALFIFVLSLVVNFLDRGILNLLITPIKRDLHLSDVQVSFLMGFAFIAFYVVLGLPIARLVDSRGRRGIITVGLGCWSVMTALCGLAQNFWSFFFCRVGVGVGEACTGPATFSMLADFFPPAKLTRAIAIMTLGTTAGVGLAQLIGAGTIQALSGVPNFALPGIGTVHNWQLVFFIVGIPGLIVAGLMTTVVEPKRRGRMNKDIVAGKAIPMSAVLNFVSSNWRCYGPLFLSLALSSLAFSGVGAWNIVFFQRSYGWTPIQSGYVLGLSVLISGPLGLALGTWLTEHYVKRGFDDANMRVARWISLIAILPPILAPLMPTPWLSVGMGAAFVLLASASGAPINAALQVVTPNEMRGQVSALYLFTLNVIGAGMGPTFIAIITDVVFHDENALRYSMVLAAAVAMPVSAICYWYCLKHYRAAVIRSKTWQ